MLRKRDGFGWRGFFFKDICITYNIYVISVTYNIYVISITCNICVNIDLR